jgi:hypothetical protein
MYLESILQRLGPPFAVFLLARGMLGVAASAMGSGPLDPKVLARWDSGHYLGIAVAGHEFFSCAHLPGYNPQHWCGNTGWFPAYPWMIRLISLAGLQPVAAGALLSALFHLGTLVLLWNKFLDAVWSRGSLLCLLLAGFFPGQVYHHAVFPVSTFTFCALLALHYLCEQRALAAGLAGAAAAFTYSTGLVLAPVALLGVLLTGSRRPWRGRLPILLVAPGLTALGFTAVLVVHQLAVGDWTAFFKVQAKYGHGLHNPLATFASHLGPLIHSPRQWAKDVPALQTCFVAGFVVALAVAIALRRRCVAPQDALLVVFMLAFWSFPLVVGAAVSPYRAESLLLPSAVLSRHLPAPAQAVLTAAAVILACPMVLLFYRGMLV